MRTLCEIEVHEGGDVQTINQACGTTVKQVRALLNIPSGYPVTVDSGDGSFNANDDFAFNETDTTYVVEFRAATKDKCDWRLDLIGC